MNADDPKRIVERGYDTIADRFAEWQTRISDETRLRYVADLLELLPERPDVLELGVGAGVESSRILAAGSRFTGIDLSREQLRRARERLPGATLIHGDFTETDLPPASFDAVVSLYVLNNLPQPELATALAAHRGVAAPRRLVPREPPEFGQPGLARRLARGRDVLRRLRPGDEPAASPKQAGLEVVRDELEDMVEPEGEVRWQWLLARRR